MVLQILENKDLILILTAILVLILVFLIIKIFKTKPKEKKSVSNTIKPNNEKGIKENKQSSSELENLLIQMQNDLKKEDEVEVLTFETEQEEKAIISYQELLKVNKPIHENTNLNETINQTNNHQIQNETLNKVEDIEEDKKFKNTDFISPIYGRQEKNYKYPTIPSFIKEIDEEVEIEEISYDLNNQLKYEDSKQVSKPIPIDSVNKNKENIEFLTYLKEFRNNLD